MGQKQLLLLVLAVVLVGMAVAAGIEVFRHYADRAAADAEQAVDVSGPFQQTHP